MLDGLVSAISNAGKRSEDELEIIKDRVLVEVFENRHYAKLSWDEKSQLAWTKFMRLARG